METSAETSRTPGAKAAFNLACARLMVLGADADLTAPGAPFTVGVIREQAKRIRDAWSNRFGEGQTPELKTIEAWATKSVPHPEAFGRFCRVIFGDKQDGRATYRVFDALWNAARSRSVISLSPATSAPSLGGGFRDLEWTPSSQSQDDGLFELRVHRPAFGNDDPETARLPVTLSFGRVETEVTHGKRRWSLRIGFEKAALHWKSVGCQPAYASRPGQGRDTAAARDVQVEAGIFHIFGPKTDSGALAGDPFGGEPACTLEPEGRAEPSVTLTLMSGVNDMSVTAMRGDQPVGTMKEKLAKAFALQRGNKIENGRTVIWGKASLRGRKRPASS